MSVRDFADFLSSCCISQILSSGSSLFHPSFLFDFEEGVLHNQDKNVQHAVYEKADEGIHVNPAEDAEDDAVAVDFIESVANLVSVYNRKKRDARVVDGRKLVVIVIVVVVVVVVVVIVIVVVVVIFWKKDR